jgi:branched-chain amino acid transport system permease protein
MDTFLRLVFSGLETGSFYALAALGIIIIFRTSVTTNFAQGVIGMFNAYAATWFLRNWGVSTLGALLLGILTAILLGILIDLIIIRRTKKVDAVGKQIITMGLILIISGLTPMLFGTHSRTFGRLIQSGSVQLGGFKLQHNSILNIVLVLSILGVLFFILQKTKWGLGVRVTAASEPTARLMGVPTGQITMAVWAIAAALSTLAALLLAPNNNVNPLMMNSVQVNAFIALVFGGFQTFYGAVVGSYIIAVTSNLLKFYVSDIWGEPLLYTAVLAFLLIRPNGLFGKKYIKKV